MKTDHLSPCVITDQVDQARDFYQQHFNARLEFDCGWYVSLVLEGAGGHKVSLQFMSPQGPEQVPFGGQGLVYNLEVDDVDAEYERLQARGLSPVMPLEDHPWGDRGFAIQDPAGVSLYIFSPREPSAEFRQYFRDE